MLRKSLANIKVVDFSQIGAGPTCSMFLGDLGADVVKVEPPNGDHGRKLGPPWYVDDESAIFVSFNRNKRSVCLDLKSEQGLEVAKKLISEADVLVESFRPGVMTRLGLGYESVKTFNPKIVYCAVSAYGSTGEHSGKAGVDGILQAASGLMMLLGEDGDAPSKVQAPIVDVSTGYMASISVIAQLFQRERTGEGGYLDVSLFATAVAIQQSSITAYLGNGELPARTGSAAPYSAPNEAFEANDGWIMVAAYLGDRWSRFCTIIEMPQLIDDSRFSSSSLRVVNRKQMRTELKEIFASKSSAHWIECFERSDILCSKVCDYKDLMSNSALHHLNLITVIEGANGHIYKSPGFPVNSRESLSAPHRAPPKLGQHTQEVLDELGYSPSQIEKMLKVGVAVI